MDTISGYSGKSYEKNVQRKDSGNLKNGVHGAQPSPKRSGTRPVRCPFLFRAIAKRPAISGSRLGRYARAGQPPGFRQGWVGPGPWDSGVAEPFPVPLALQKAQTANFFYSEEGFQFGCYLLLR